MKVLLVADVGERAPGYFHVGDEAIFEAWVARYRAEGAELVCPSWSPGSHAHLGVREIPFFGMSRETIAPLLDRCRDVRIADHPGLGRLAALVESVDVVHLAGGGNLNGIFAPELYRRAVFAVLGRALRRRVMVTGQTLGPVDGLDADVLAALIEAADRLTVRDEGSRELARRLAPTTAAPDVAPDDAFEVVPEAEGVRQAEDVVRAFAGRTIVATSIHRWSGDTEALVEAVAGALRHLARRRALAVVGIPHVVVAGDGDHDVPVLRALAARLGGDVPALVVDGARLHATHPHRVSFARALTARSSVVVATRYHAAVFAASAHVPALGLAWDDYYRRKLGALVPTLPAVASTNEITARLESLLA